MEVGVATSYVLALLLCGTAHAQSASELGSGLGDPRPRLAEVAPLPPVPPPPHVARDRERPSDAAPQAPRTQHRASLSVLWEITGGILGWGLGITPVLLGATPCLLPVTIPFGITTGITLGGAASGGNGSFWSVFGGQALGGLASIPLVLLADPEVALAAVFLFPLIGGVAGYEYSNRIGYGP